MLGNNHSGKWVLFPASSMDGMALSISAARGDVCRSAVWSFQENCSRKLNPWEVLSIYSSPSFLFVARVADAPTAFLNHGWLQVGGLMIERWSRKVEDVWVPVLPAMSAHLWTSFI